MASLSERLWRKVTKTDACWLWTGATLRFGYGVIGRAGRGTGTMLVHRLSWELSHGAIPAGQCVLHQCDVPNCVNPEHLFLGTYADNNHDMWKKGRGGSGFFGKSGRNHPRAKLTTKQISNIRRMAIIRGSSARVAKRFGVCIETVRRIVRRDGCYVD